jgi:translation initiation factor 1A
MPKNSNAGGGNKRRKGKGNNSEQKEKELIIKEEGQEYATVVKMSGDGRLEGKCFDGTTRVCIIRGKMKKKVWVAQGDIILVGLRDYQDSKADVIHKYSPTDARKLKAMGELPSDVEINSNEKLDGKEEEMPFDFADI